MTESEAAIHIECATPIPLVQSKQKPHSEAAWKAGATTVGGTIIERGNRMERGATREGQAIHALMLLLANPNHVSRSKLRPIASISLRLAAYGCSCSSERSISSSKSTTEFRFPLALSLLPRMITQRLSIRLPVDQLVRRISTSSPNLGCGEGI